MIKSIDSTFLQSLNLPLKDSHKSQNGKLAIIGGSKLFHGASLWALKVASRIVDMVYYIAITENQELARHLKQNLYAFINVPPGKEKAELAGVDTILIGPGMVRGTVEEVGTGESGEQTRAITLDYLHSFSEKKWLVDAGALQAVTPAELMALPQVVITPHVGEFERVFQLGFKIQDLTLEEKITLVEQKAKEINGVIVLKGPVDIIASPDQVILNQTGNEGMTKGGTGDVLAGLIAALMCTNDLFTAAAVGTYINGLAGDELYKKVGPYFNADDLADTVPKVLWQQIQACQFPQSMQESGR